MAQNQQHGDQSVGGENTQDGIQGTPSGTEGATTGQGIDKGASRQRTQNPGNRQSGQNETYQRNDLFDDEARGKDTDAGKTQRSDSQQSGPREGLGAHRASQRGNRQGVDVERDSEETGGLHSDKDTNREP